ncbi:hypothetical protein JOM49_005846 [Amycolatopsis magusensis]|uniref:Uncharacterized protein n=1 Tax=Amycolatopsis magusensis TaxID=882444 RepID=A0ABS4PY18_9PSEU|nr:hypothetical protein [Amycolatopsis magusensis]
MLLILTMFAVLMIGPVLLERLEHRMVPPPRPSTADEELP